jgi:hypothetical protein
MIGWGDFRTSETTRTANFIFRRAESANSHTDSHAIDRGDPTTFKPPPSSPSSVQPGADSSESATVESWTAWAWAPILLAVGVALGAMLRARIEV